MPSSSTTGSHRPGSASPTDHSDSAAVQAMHAHQAAAVRTQSLAQPQPAQRSAVTAPGTDGAVLASVQEALEDEKAMFAAEVDAEVARWAGPDYNPNNIRTLLAGFHVRTLRLSATLPWPARSPWCW